MYTRDLLIMFQTNNTNNMNDVFKAGAALPAIAITATKNGASKTEYFLDNNLANKVAIDCLDRGASVIKTPVNIITDSIESNVVVDV